MKYQKLPAVILAGVLLLCAAGCGNRSRIAAVPQEEPPQLEQPQEEPNTTEEQPREEEPVPEQTEISEPDPQQPTEESAESDRKEFDANASAEVTPEAENTASHQEPEAQAPAAPGNGGESGAVETELPADLQITETVSAEEAEQLGVSPDAETADSTLQYYLALLTSRMDALFECQRAYVYWETATDYETVFKSSEEYAIILMSGAYDVSSRLMETALNVDDGWVIRKNPGAIIKCVGTDVLGEGIVSTEKAKTVKANILARPGWDALDAAKSDTVLVLSQELMKSPAGQVAAAVYIAKALYPSVMPDVDADEAMRQLWMESAGTEPGGIYAYIG